LNYWKFKTKAREYETSLMRVQKPPGEVIPDYQAQTQLRIGAREDETSLMRVQKPPVSSFLDN
jgi:hypothetical protein